eukprot:2583213-Rhodomonas_salina.1
MIVGGGGECCRKRCADHDTQCLALSLSCSNILSFTPSFPPPLQPLNASPPTRTAVRPVHRNTHWQV